MARRRPAPGNPDALATARVLTVDAATMTRLGRKHFPQTLPLAAREVVLTFDDGPEPATTARVLDALKRECVRASFFSMSADQELQQLLARLEATRGGIVLFHDTKAQTAAMLPALLRVLKNRDYRVVHVVAAPRQASTVSER
jgi:peptidoglycan/xylan/chitin deacetylase (PgdA/CDA1 family)